MVVPLTTIKMLSFFISFSLRMLMLARLLTASASTTSQWLPYIFEVSSFIKLDNVILVMFTLLYVALLPSLLTLPSLPQNISALFLYFSFGNTNFSASLLNVFGKNFLFRFFITSYLLFASEDTWLLM